MKKTFKIGAIATGGRGRNAWQAHQPEQGVIMAAGAFIQGSSIELSADGPFQPPYTVYMQGGLTYESGRLGVMMAVSSLLENKE